MDKDDIPLIGPRYLEELNPAPTDVRLNDGTPLYHLLINDNRGVITAGEVHDAKNRLAELAAEHRQEILSCQNKTARQAKDILDALQSGPEEERKAA